MAGEIPSGEGSVFHFLDIFALGCGLEACSALFNGRPWWLVAAGVLGAIGFHLLGTKWPAMKTRLWPRLGSGIEHLAGNRYLRFAIFVLVIGYFVVNALLFIHKLRSDLDTYVLPRTVTAQQAKDLREYLSNHQPCAISMRVVPNDAEAMEYASALFRALISTKCAIDPPKHDGPEVYIPATVPRAPINYFAYKSQQDYLMQHSEWLEAELTRYRYIASTGLCVGTDIDAHRGPWQNPDPHHPAPEVIVQDALKYAQIDTLCTGNVEDEDQNTVPLLVGHRPLAMRTRPLLSPIYQRIERWLPK